MSVPAVSAMPSQTADRRAAGVARNLREGTQNVLCAILAAAVLVGLTANTLFGLWWLDPAIALAISAMCVREGQKAWRGEQCGCATCS